MPRYFFHIRDGGELIKDSIGVELPSHRFVANECCNLIQDVLSESEWQDTLDEELSFEVTDEQNHVTLIVPFLEISRPCGKVVGIKRV
jgi:hypothetical protein